MNEYLDAIADILNAEGGYDKPLTEISYVLISAGYYISDENLED